MSKQQQPLPALRPAEADLVYQLLYSPDEVWTPTAPETSLMRRMCRRHRLGARALIRPFVPAETFNAFRSQVLLARTRTAAAGQTLNTEDGAILAAIRQCPEYRFCGDELRAAKRLHAAGVLRPASKKGRFLVTLEGYVRYDWDCVRRP